MKNTFKQFRFINILLLLATSFLLLTSCSNLLEAKQSNTNVSIKFNTSFIKFFLGDNSSQRSSVQTDWEAHLVLEITGDYASSDDLIITNEKTFSHSIESIPVGAVIKIHAEIYALPSQNNVEKIVLYSGTTQDITIKEGDNPVSIVLKAQSNPWPTDAVIPQPNSGVFIFSYADDLSETPYTVYLLNVSANSSFASNYGNQLIEEGWSYLPQSGTYYIVKTTGDKTFVHYAYIVDSSASSTTGTDGTTSDGTAADDTTTVSAYIYVESREAVITDATIVAGANGNVITINKLPEQPVEIKQITIAHKKKGETDYSQYADIYQKKEDGLFATFDKNTPITFTDFFVTAGETYDYKIMYYSDQNIYYSDAFLRNSTVQATGGLGDSLATLSDKSATFASNIVTLNGTPNFVAIPEQYGTSTNYIRWDWEYDVPIDVMPNGTKSSGLVGWSEKNEYTSGKPSYNATMITDFTDSARLKGIRFERKLTEPSGKTVCFNSSEHTTYDNNTYFDTSTLVPISINDISPPTIIFEPVTSVWFVLPYDYGNKFGINVPDSIKSDLAEIRIFRQSAEETDYTYYSTILNPSGNISTMLNDYNLVEYTDYFVNAGTEYSYKIKYVDSKGDISDALLSQELTQKAPASSLGTLPTLGDTSLVAVTKEANTLTFANLPTFPEIPSTELGEKTTGDPSIRCFYIYKGVETYKDCSTTDSTSVSFKLQGDTGASSGETITLTGIGASYVIQDTITVTINNVDTSYDIITSYGSNESKITKINLDAVDTSLPKDFTTVAQ